MQTIQSLIQGAAESSVIENRVERDRTIELTITLPYFGKLTHGYKLAQRIMRELKYIGPDGVRVRVNGLEVTDDLSDDAGEMYHSLDWRQTHEVEPERDGQVGARPQDTCICAENARRGDCPIHGESGL